MVTERAWEAIAKRRPKWRTWDIGGNAAQSALMARAGRF